MKFPLFGLMFAMLVAIVLLCLDRTEQKPIRFDSHKVQFENPVQLDYSWQDKATSQLDDHEYRLDDHDARIEELEEKVCECEKTSVASTLSSASSDPLQPVCDCELCEPVLETVSSGLAEPIVQTNYQASYQPVVAYASWGGGSSGGGSNGYSQSGGSTGYSAVSRAPYATYSGGSNGSSIYARASNGSTGGRTYQAVRTRTVNPRFRAQRVRSVQRSNTCINGI